MARRLWVAAACVAAWGSALQAGEIVGHSPRSDSAARANRPVAMAPVGHLVNSFGDFGWVNGDTRGGGTVTFVAGPAGAPLGTGSLRLFTGASGSDKATIDRRLPNLGLVVDFTASYDWYRVTGGPAPAPALKLGIDTADPNPSTPTAIARGEDRFDKILVFEPYLNPLGRVLSDNVWTSETITQAVGKFWIVDLDGSVAPGYGIGGPYLTLADWQADVNYGAVLSAGTITSIQFGVGSGNPGHESYVDNFAYTITGGDFVVNFDPQPVTVLTLDTSDCAAPGGTLTVALDMSDADDAIVGGQFFLEYDNALLDFVSAVPVTPFDETYESVTTTGVVGAIDYAVNAPFGDPGVAGSASLAVFTFAIEDVEVCSATDLVRFRTHVPPTRLTMFGGSPITPSLVDLAPVGIDDTPPSITCAADQNVDTDPGACTAIVGFAAPIVSDGCGTYDAYFEGFEDPGFDPGGPVLGNDFSNTGPGWNHYNSTVSRVPSGTGGIASKTGGYHAVIDSTSLPASPDDYTGLFGRLGGYSSAFDGGLTAAVDVYLDLADPAVTGDTYGWDLSVAANNQSGGHLRDFIFHAASNASGEILIGGSNNSNFTRRNDLGSINHHTVTASGWYTFEFVFRDAGDGSLAVDLNLRDAGGTLLWTETRNNPADDIDTIVGGNRYMWFTFLEVDTLAIDTTRLIRGSGDPLDVVCSAESGDAFGVGPTVVTCSATDACGNTDDCTFTITVTDDELPSIVCPSNVAQSTDPGLCTATVSIPVPDTDDNCGVASVTNDYTNTNDASGVYPVGVTVVAWTVTDVNSNVNTTCMQTVTITDDEDPQITCPADVNQTADPGVCNAAVDMGDPIVSDNCGIASVLNSFNSTIDGDDTYPVGTTNITWTVTDNSSNVSSCPQTVTITDDEDPQITGCPGDIVQSSDAGGCDAEIDWLPPVITDNCSVDVTANYSPPHVFAASGTPYGVSYEAEDPSGNTATCDFDVTVNAVNDMLVDVQLSPTVSAGPFTRCITFEFYDGCPGSPVETVEAVMTFASGMASGTVQVACGDYDCVTAQDKLHTLRRTDEAFGVVGDNYEADFTGNVDMTGDWLVGGNLNDDPYIDILDFGVFSFQYVSNPTPGASTTCATVGPHGDVSGDGVVDSLDFTFIALNFLDLSEAGCCGLLLFAEDDGPVMDISLAELKARGLGQLGVADLNRDGRLNEADIAAFYAGARPRAGISRQERETRTSAPLPSGPTPLGE